MYTVIGMNSICNPNLKHKGVQFLEVSRVYKHLRFTPVPLTNPKITFEVFKIWKQKTIFVVKSQMTQFFEDSHFFKITVPSNCVATKIFPFTIVKPVINQKAHLKNFLPFELTNIFARRYQLPEKGSKYLKLFLLNYVGSKSRVAVFFYQ